MGGHGGATLPDPQLRQRRAAHVGCSIFYVRGARALRSVWRVGACVLVRACERVCTSLCFGWSSIGMCARVGVSVRVSALLVGAPETLCCCVFVSRVVPRCVESVQDFSRQCYI